MDLRRGNSPMPERKGAIMVYLVLAGLVLAAAAGTTHAQTPPGERSRTFAETGKTVRGLFLDYWERNGGLTQQGFPISELLSERSDLDGKTYTVQYFERAVFEYHPENQAPHDVVLSQLGTFRYREKYRGDAPGQQPNSSPGSVLFSETGRRLGGRFLDYWQRNGGLAQHGYPISNEFEERSDLDGKTYRVQYFERSVFEHHPDNRPPYDVLLSQLGTFRYQARYVARSQPPGPTATVTPTRDTGGDCRPTRGGEPPTEEQAPVRGSVGKGHVLSGRVLSSNGCQPVAGAKLVFWLANPQSEYDDDHRATVFTDSSGAYTFESNYPGVYEGTAPHIHVAAYAKGYRSLITEYLPPRGRTEGTFDIILVGAP